MTAEFVKLMARGENPLRSIDMIAPADQALDALWKLAIELPCDMSWEACPVDDIHLRSQS